MQIGSLAAKLTAYDAGFSSTLNKAQRQVTAFSKAVSAVGTGIGIGIGSAIASAVGAIPGKIASVVTGQMEAVDKAAKASDSLGVATEKLIGLGYAGELAGTSMDDIAGALTKMSKTLGEAISGTQTARDSFSALGIDISAFSGMDAVDQFKAIGDAINKLPTAAQRTAAAMDIFGKGAASIIPLLQSGSDSIDAATKEAEAFGLAINRVDAAKVEQANDAMTRVQAAIKGLGTTLAVQLAPWITKLATDFVNWAMEGGRATKFIIDAMEWVAMAIVRVGEAVSAFQAVWYYLKGAVISVANAILVQWQMIISHIIDGLNAIGLASDGMLSFRDSFKEVTDGMAAQATEAFGEASKIMDDIGSDAAANRVKKWFADARASAEAFGKSVAAAKPGAVSIDVEGADRLKKVGDIISKLQDELDGLTVTPLQKIINSLKEAGASVLDIEKAGQLFNQIDLTKFANSVMDALKTPADLFQEMIDKLGDAINAGLLTADQAAQYAASKITGVDRAQPVASPGLLLANSAQAQLFQFNAGKKPVEDQQLAVQKQMAASLADIKRNTAVANDGDYSGL